MLCRLSPPSRLVRQYVAGLPISDALERPKRVNRQYIAAKVKAHQLWGDWRAFVGLWDSNPYLFSAEKCSEPVQ